MDHTGVTVRTVTGPVEHDAERARQESLGRYAILDTPPEMSFDCITAVLARLLHVPAAVVTFIDRDRQWFKSRVGIDVAQTPREISFCAHTIRSASIMVVSDTLLDRRFADNPLVTGPPNIRFYAGAPLITPDGVAVGTLAAVSSTPRGLNEEEAVLLRRLAGLVVKELEQRATGIPGPGAFCDDLQLALVLEHLPAVLWTTDNSLRFTSTVGTDLGGLKLGPEQLRGMPLEEYMGGRDRAEEVLSHHRRALDGHTVHYQLGDLGQEWLATIRPLRSPGGNVVGTIGIAMDVTERNRLQAHVLQREHLAALGTLASGIAHELNNPLSYILANANVAVEEVSALVSVVPPGSRGRLAELRTLLDEVAQGAGRAASVVRDLKLFARGEEDASAACDPRLAVRAALRLTHSELRMSAKVREELGEVPLVMASQARLVSLLVNVLVNAAQAIGVGRVADNEIWVRTRTGPDGWAILEVCDTGTGISPEVAARVFDPFFTTKPFGVGRGLGLSLCHGIVTALGGRIELGAGLAGKGTTVRVLLPPVEPMEAPAATPTRVRVLVVDDEDAVCRSLRRVLGPTVDTEIRHSGREALELLERDSRFDVILCDVLMPDGDGAEVYEHLAARAPELAARLVFVTGGGMPRCIADRVPAARVLEKPFDIETVRGVVSVIARGPSVR